MARGKHLSLEEARKTGKLAQAHLPSVVSELGPESGQRQRAGIEAWRHGIVPPTYFRPTLGSALARQRAQRSAKERLSYSMPIG